MESHRVSSMGANNNNKNYNDNDDRDSSNGYGNDAQGAQMETTRASGGRRAAAAAVAVEAVATANGRQSNKHPPELAPAPDAAPAAAAAEQSELVKMVTQSRGDTNIILGKATIRTISSQKRNTNHQRREAAQPIGGAGGKASLFVSILLPILLVFLLPSSSPTKEQHHELQSWRQPSDYSLLDQLLVSLLRLPLDRIRLQCGSTMLLAGAKEITAHSQPLASRHVAPADLQEEETHMLVMAPDQQQVHHQRASGFQLAPARGPASAYGGGAGEQESPSSYGGGPADFGAAGSQHHANLINEPADDAASGAEVMPASASGSVVAPSGGSAAATRTDLPSVRALNVKCEKNHMTVNIVFDRPFYGMVFSKGHYNDQKCVHLPPNSGQTSVNFDIHLGKCGMSSSSDSAAPATTTGQQSALAQTASANQQQQQPNGLFIENTIIIQYDPQVQEIYDQARRLRCTWYDYYEKSVTFRPYNVDMLDAVTANFLGDNIQCWMQIQVGKGPWSSEVAGIVKIGQTMTMVLAIKDDENKFDMLVRNCVASDGKHQPIQLVDEYGCVARPKIMAKFQKVRNFGPAATVVSYAHFQAFKFPDSMSVHFQCVIQVCRYECPEPVCSAASAPALADTPSSAAGPAGLAPPPPPQDYAVSGTELVSSKELMPSAAMGLGRHNLSQQHPLRQQHQSQGSNSVNLKLDESQGRVQVKLDTSMMANANNNNNAAASRPSGGALPPHLLHASNQHQADQTAAGGYATPGGRGGHTYMSSSYYRPSLGGATASAAAAPSASVGLSRPGQAVAAPPAAQQYSNPAAASSLLPPAHHHHHPRPAYMMTNRMGELVAEDGYQQHEAADTAKLSLIATPRALPYAMPTTASLNHRYRRSINASSHQHADTPSPKSKRQTSGAGQAADLSTAVKTQRTIQVVSPDDVAFSLIDLDGPQQSESWPPRKPQRANNRPQQHGGDQFNPDDSTMVCFSSARLVSSALASLALLVTLILAAAFIIMRQRKRLNEKLSPLYDHRSSASDLIINNNRAPTMSHQMQHQQQQQRQRAAVEAEMILRRQREELQQRNTYLGRLYSQFVPAAYWR